jgi:hypothetical protein
MFHALKRDFLDNDGPADAMCCATDATDLPLHDDQGVEPIDHFDQKKRLRAANNALQSDNN